jgi:hypothetical protein
MRFYVRRRLVRRPGNAKPAWLLAVVAGIFCLYTKNRVCVADFLYDVAEATCVNLSATPNRGGQNKNSVHLLMFRSKLAAVHIIHTFNLKGTDVLYK